MEDDPVAVVKMDGISEDLIGKSVRNLLKILSCDDDLSDVKDAVIKPNLCSEKDWTTGTTTCPVIIREVATWLLDHGVNRITVADGSVVGKDTFEVMEKTGVMDVVEELNLNAVDLNKDDTVKVKVPSPIVHKEIQLARTPLEADYMVNIPVMKTHICTGVTLSIKNLKGLLPPAWKKRFHFMGLDGSLADLASVVSPDLNILDGTVGMEGQGPITGIPKNAGLLMGSKNHLTLDVAASRIMGFDPAEIRHLVLYAESTGINISEFTPHVIGDTDFKIEFKKPISAHEGYFPGVDIVWGDPCSGCDSALGAALSGLAKEGELENLKEMGGITIVIGQKAEPPEKERVLLIGKCQYRNRHKGIFIPGCPPQGFLIRGIIDEIMGKESEYRSEDLLKEAEEMYGKGP